MSSKPYFSIFGPAIRPQFYENVYNNVSDGNDIPFEIVFVGNKPPTKTMPDNFRYIYSDKTPCQCWDIAARESKAELIISSGDDVLLSKNFLNRTYYYSNIFDLDKILIAFRYRFQWGPSYYGVAIDEGGFYDFGRPGNPVIGAGGVFRKDLWEKLGGLDSRFYGSFADVDMTFRFYYELGMSIFIPPDCTITEIPKVDKRGANLTARSNPLPFLRTLWTKDGVFVGERSSLVESFIYD